MSTFRVLQDLSVHIRASLFEGLRDIEVTSGSFSDVNAISLDSPAELDDDGGNGGNAPLLSFYLYQVTPDSNLNNWPQIRVGPGEQHFPPMSLSLFYLLTPLSGNPLDDLLILGRSLQALAATPTLRANFLDSLLRSNPPEARLTINPVTLEELTRIWNAFNQPYRLSMCYKVQVVSIDSLRTPRDGPPVAERLLDIHQTLPELSETT